VLEFDRSVESFDDALTYEEAKAYSTSVDLLCAPQLSKHLEKLPLVFWRDAKACVHHASLEVLGAVVVLKSYRNRASVSELDCVLHQVQEDLSNSLNVYY
jgi:hypothetical protein